MPEHTKECEYRITHGIRHDNCFCECHDKGKYHGSNEPKDRQEWLFNSILCDLVSENS